MVGVDLDHGNGREAGGFMVVSNVSGVFVIGYITLLEDVVVGMLLLGFRD